MVALRKYLKYWIYSRIMDDRIGRRAALKRASTGVCLSVLGGCLGTTERSEPTTTSSRTTSATRTSTTTVPTLDIGDTAPVADGRLAATAAGLQRFVLDVYKHPHAEVVSDPSTKYLTFELMHFDLDVVPVTVVLVTDDGRESVDFTDLYYGYDYSTNTEKVGFEFDEDATTSRAELRYLHDGEPAAGWRVDQATVRRFNHPPKLELRSISIPDEVATGERIEAEVRVRNSGETRGEFVANVGTTNRSHLRIERIPVAPETATTRHVSLGSPSQSGSVTVVFDYGRRRIERDVTVT